MLTCNCHYLHSCSLESLPEVGVIHTIVELVAGVDVELEACAHFAIGGPLDPALQLLPDIFVFVIVSEFFV